MQSPNRNEIRRADADTFRLRRAPRGSIATHRALFASEGERRCDLCDATLAAGDDGGSGLYVWARAGEVRYEEPPLCSKCGPSLALAAMRMWDEEDEEEG